MTRTLPIMEARKKLNSLPEALVHDGEVDVMEITRRGKPVLAVLPWELYEAITETLEVMADQELLQKLRRSVREMEEGATPAGRSATGTWRMTWRIVVTPTALEMLKEICGRSASSC